MLPRVDRLVAAVVARLPQPAGEDAKALDHAEATGRRLAARRSAASLQMLHRLPGLDHGVLDQATDTFRGFENEALDRLAHLDDSEQGGHLQRDQAEALSRAVSAEALDELAEAGVLPMTVREAAADIIGEVR